MKLKRKYSDMVNFDYVKTHRAVSKSCKINNQNICLSLLYYDKVHKPLTISSFNKELTIIDDDYAWLWVSPLDEHVTLIVIYDEEGSIVEYYFDILDQNINYKEHYVYYDDYFIDVVVNPNNEVSVLDKDELDNALNQAVITKEVYDLALETVDKLIAYIHDYFQEISTFSINEYQNLKALL